MGVRAFADVDGSDGGGGEGGGGEGGGCEGVGGEGVGGEGGCEGSGGWEALVGALAARAEWRRGRRGRWWQRRAAVWMEGGEGSGGEGGGDGGVDKAKGKDTNQSGV
jgi:hypothetical protein